MPEIRISRFLGLLLFALLATGLTACLTPEPPPIYPGTGGSSASGQGGTNGSDPGSAGTTGAGAGNAGTSGSVVSGSAGTTGNAGTTGTAGTTGNAGTTGSAGTTGNAGTTGTAGTTGNAGTTGAGGRGGTGGGSAGRGGTGGGSAGRGGTGGGSAGRGGTGGTSTGGSTGNAPVAYVVCTPCHGNDGMGVANKGPDIQHPVVDYFTWVIRNGRTHPNFPDPMPMFTTATLPDADLQSILSFLAAFPKQTTGAGLFRDYCANCHGADAAGGVTTRPIATEPMSMFTTLVRNGHSAGMFSNRREFMPRWTTAQISDAELMLIFTYVSGL